MAVLLMAWRFQPLVNHLNEAAHVNCEKESKLQDMASTSTGNSQEDR
jgi:hypothetical protein